MLKLILKKLTATMNVIRYTPGYAGFSDCHPLTLTGLGHYIFPILPTYFETTAENLTLPKPIPAGHRKSAVACASSIADIDMYFVPATKRDNKKRNRTVRGSKANGTKRSVGYVKVGCPSSDIYDMVEMVVCPRCGNEAQYGQLCACDYVVCSIPSPENIEHNLQ